MRELMVLLVFVVGCTKPQEPSFFVCCSQQDYKICQRVTDSIVYAVSSTSFCVAGHNLKKVENMYEDMKDMHTSGDLK